MLNTLELKGPSMRQTRAAPRDRAGPNEATIPPRLQKLSVRRALLRIG